MTMSAIAKNIRERVARIERTPAIPAVLLPLLKLLNLPADRVDLDEVARLVSYDQAIAAQCLRMAGSPLFGLAQPPKSIAGAVVILGLHRVESILLTCCMGMAFPVKSWAIDPAVFWRHSLGCAMVCRKFSEILPGADAEKAYAAGLLHDLGILVNCLAFPEDYAMAVERARQNQMPLDEVERATMGFTHCESGRALAEQWGFAEEVVQVVAHHHAAERSETSRSLVALVHLSDLLCRMRGLDYGYYERHKVDLLADPAWSILLQEHSDLGNVDLVRFTFELDETIGEIRELVAMVLGTAARA
jgi:putative nucleotidyltransferase with HDIG domain